MNNPVKKTAAINDLSGYGRASLLSAIPVLSYMGIQVCPVPTAVLSTHTTDFEGFSFLDLTNEMKSYLNHWKNLDLYFECVYTGFIGSAEQASVISDFIDFEKKKGSLIVVDPVLGDEGELYSTVTGDIVESMKALVSKADIITPNFLEAHSLLGMEYDGKRDVGRIKSMMKNLSDMGPSKIVITGVSEDNEIIDIFTYDREENSFYDIKSRYIPVYYPGTGDIFTSVLTGAVLNGESIENAAAKGASFILRGIAESENYSYPRREGILLERVLKWLDEESPAVIEKI